MKVYNLIINIIDESDSEVEIYSFSTREIAQEHFEKVIANIPKILFRINKDRSSAEFGDDSTVEIEEQIIDEKIFNW